MGSVQARQIARTNKQIRNDSPRAARPAASSSARLAGTRHRQREFIRTQGGELVTHHSPPPLPLLHHGWVRVRPTPSPLRSRISVASSATATGPTAPAQTGQVVRKSTSIRPRRVFSILWPRLVSVSGVGTKPGGMVDGASWRAWKKALESRLPLPQTDARASQPARPLPLARKVRRRGEDVK